jgi:hypothetical protein
VSTGEYETPLEELDLLARVDSEKRLKQFLFISAAHEASLEPLNLTNERSFLLKIVSSGEQG